LDFSGKETGLESNVNAIEAFTMDKTRATKRRHDLNVASPSAVGIIPLLALLQMVNCRREIFEFMMIFDQCSKPIGETKL
jgi:hypothetical protein